MAIPVLGDYEYQFREDGIKLNSSAVLPFIDVISVTGLDMAEVDVSEVDIDGTHGGVVSAAFFKSRTIVIDCIIYADPYTVDATLDALQTNYLPGPEAPFFFKGAGIGQRFLNCKSLGIKYNLDSLRRIGSCTAQIQLKAADPVKYVETKVNLTNNANAFVVNAGNMATWPIFRVASGEYTAITFTNTTYNKSLTATLPATTSTILDVDFNKKMIYVNGIRNSSILGNGVVDWWAIQRGANQIKYTLTGAGTVPTVALTWRSGWA